MSRLKKVASELADMGRHDLAQQVALASLEMKGWHQDDASTFTRLASGMDLKEEISLLVQRYQKELAVAIGRESHQRPLSISSQKYNFSMQFPDWELYGIIDPDYQKVHVFRQDGDDPSVQVPIQDTGTTAKEIVRQLRKNGFNI